MVGDQGMFGKEATSPSRQISVQPRSPSTRPATDPPGPSVRPKSLNTARLAAADRHIYTVITAGPPKAGMLRQSSDERACAWRPSGLKIE